MALGTRIKRLEEAMAPERQIFVVQRCYDCGRALDEAAEAAYQQQGRAGDFSIAVTTYVGCPHCGNAPWPKTRSRHEGNGHGDTRPS
jgi:hypothetical protein